MTTTITGEVGSEVAAPLAFGALIDGTTVSSVVLRATPPRGAAVQTWTTAIESPLTTSLTAVHTIAAQLAAGVWWVRPFVYVGGVIVTSRRFKSLRLIVTPDQVSAP